MAKCKRMRNLMNELRDVICEIECLKPKSEECNVICPTTKYLENYLRKFSCYDPCRIMPCPSFHLPPRCCTTDSPKDDVDNCLLAYVCPSDLDRKRSISRKSNCFRSVPHTHTQCQEIYYPPCNFTLITSAPSYCTVEPVIYWNVW